MFVLDLNSVLRAIKLVDKTLNFPCFLRCVCAHQSYCCLAMYREAKQAGGSIRCWAEAAGCLSDFPKIGIKF